MARLRQRMPRPWTHGSRTEDERSQMAANNEGDGPVMKRGGFAAMGTLACALMLAVALPAMAAPPSQAAEKTGDGPGVAETAKGTGEVRTDGDVPADAELTRSLDELLEPTWETDVACTTCHANLAEPDASCLIARHANIACAACHDDVATLEKIHEGAPVKEAPQSTPTTFQITRSIRG